MCGLGGILRTDGRPIDETWLHAIDQRVAHRGPDGEGRFRDRVVLDHENTTLTAEIAFVHRRLSIIDHADGTQPMVSQRGRTDNEGLVAVVFNGCIYNHRELRGELSGLGHKFHTDHSDTEVLVHGWREWGSDLPEHLQGMFAFAIWDRSQGVLTLARDRFGKKPLYYRCEPAAKGNGLLVVFASDARSAAVGLTPTISDHDALLESLGSYLQLGYGWLGRSIAVHAAPVMCLQPNSVVQFHAVSGEQSVETHPEQQQNVPLNGARLRGLIEQAVVRRLDADVPLGCFLSGGVDSSLIAYFARKHKPDLRTFCVRMPDPRFDESRHAEHVARHIGSNHTTLDVSAEPAEDLRTLIEQLGQPFGDSSLLPTYWVSKAARRHVRVVLTGDGGDELFVGYERYLAARALAIQRSMLTRVPKLLLKRTSPKSKLHKLGRLGEMARDFSACGILAMESLFTQEQIAQLLGAPAPKPVRWNPQPDALAALRQADLAGYLPFDLLAKVDTASMAVALEARCPFLDRDLAREVLAAPVDQLIPDGKRKGLLRKIARAHLPREVIDRAKAGFAIPIGEWFRSNHGQLRTLLTDQLGSAEPFGPMPIAVDAARRMMDEHLAKSRDHGQRLFALLTLSLWARNTFGRD
jgi:asparagine synthase (glutamine-hydrolysing)